MDFRRQKYFLAVAQHQGFRKAAEVLNVSQPALSQQIHALEEELGFPLFDRSERTIKLTAAGEEYRRGVEAMLDDFQHWVRRAKDAHEGEVNALTVGVNTFMLYSFLPAIALEFRKAHPNVRFNLTVSASSDILGQLFDGHVDVALTGYNGGDDEILTTPLLRLPARVALPIDHPQASNEVVDLRTLEGETLYVPAMPSQSLGQEQVIEICRAQGLKSFRVHEVVGDKASLAMLGFIACGLGFGLLPVGFEDILPERVVFRQIARLQRELVFSACVRRGNSNASVDEFIRIAQRHSNLNASPAP